MSYSKDQFRRMESTQGRLIKQCLGLPKSSHNTAMLKALNIDTVQNTVNRNVLNLYHRIFKIESPARSIMQFLLARYITYGTTVVVYGIVKCGPKSAMLKDRDFEEIF